MRRMPSTWICLVALLLWASPVFASYMGLSVSLWASTGGHDVYRVYANFTDANDYCTGISGSTTLGALKIQTLNADGSALGSNFYNPGGSTGNLAPFEPNGSWEWGTFATVGVGLGNQAPDGVDMTSTNPIFPNFINGNLLTSLGISWFIPGPLEQGRAGYEGDDDPLLRVLVMQLAVNAGEHVMGTVAVSGVEAGPSGSAPFQKPAQTFNSVPVPCPADVNVSGEVNVDDLFVIIGFWHATPPAYPAADVTGDGTVNVDDLFAVINAWGPCP